MPKAARSSRDPLAFDPAFSRIDRKIIPTSQRPDLLFAGLTWFKNVVGSLLLKHSWPFLPVALCWPDDRRFAAVTKFPSSLWKFRVSPGYRSNRPVMKTMQLVDGRVQFLKVRARITCNGWTSRKGNGEDNFLTTLHRNEYGKLQLTMSLIKFHLADD